MVLSLFNGVQLADLLLLRPAGPAHIAEEVCNKAGADAAADPGAHLLQGPAG